jgi:hypothetical protein
VTRRPEVSSEQSSPLYAWLLRREQEAHERPGLTLPWTQQQPSYTGSPATLEALRNGQPVDVSVSALPKWAREGEQLTWTRRATVSPDGAVVLRDDAAAWMGEQGL